ncbi:MAG: excalibur calcium-binding domain-containing protein [Phormidium sp.]
MLKALTQLAVLATIIFWQYGCHKPGLGNLLNPPKSTSKTIDNVTQASPSTINAQLHPCVQKKCNCRDFSHQREAQAVLDAFPNDPHRLDRNKNGLACESLPK